MLISENGFTSAIEMLQVRASSENFYRDAGYTKTAFPRFHVGESQFGFGKRYAVLSLALNRLSRSTDRFRADYQWACRFLLPHADLSPIEVECIDLYRMAGWAGVKKCS